MIIVTGSIIVEPQHYNKALRLSLDHVRRSREEPGCLDHRVAIDSENENRLVFVEFWENMTALQQHFSLDASKNFVSELKKCSAKPPQMRIFKADEISTF
ncbi:MAG: putative quinol monooxygenase [Pseudomonadota bacterium]